MPSNNSRSPSSARSAGPDLVGFNQILDYRIRTLLQHIESFIPPGPDKALEVPPGAVVVFRKAASDGDRNVAQKVAHKAMIDSS